LVWEEFVYGGHVLALSAVAMIWTFALLVYCGTRSCYPGLGDKDSEQGANAKRIQRLTQNYPLVKAQLVILVLLVLALLWGHLSTLLLGLGMLALGILYTVVLKNFPGFKNFFIPVPVVLLLALYGVYYWMEYSRLFSGWAFFLSADFYLVLFLRHQGYRGRRPKGAENFCRCFLPGSWSFA